ncbi:hypothetical protein [Paraburkholderia sp. C35]|uniref:hypothetical protein n=1 Tax=Paraburkholderia sp. C35 TaxID=2126993 RepID=UPI000D69DD45|nr:hypothetical protein [Paraburkholderia sp. C35]
METQISVPVQTQQFISLVDFLRSNGDSRDPVLVVTEAIDYWMENASWKSELLKKSATLGYQWKEVFMEDGTEVRMQYKGQYYYAKVEGDQLIYEGAPTTPGSLANTIANSSRNAWRDLWLKLPSDPQWRLADDCRGLALGAMFNAG